MFPDDKNNSSNEMNQVRSNEMDNETDRAKSPYINYSLLSDHIKAYRRLRNKKQSEVAEDMGYSQVNNYGKIERCEQISLKLIAKVCIALQVPLEDMLRGCLKHEPWPENPSIYDDNIDMKAFCDLFNGQSKETIRIAYAICKTFLAELERSKTED